MSVADRRFACKLGRSLGSLALLAQLACSRSLEQEARPLASSSLARDAKPVAAPPPIEPLRLLTLNDNAYQVTLLSSEDTSYLITKQAAYQLAPGKATVRWAHEFGQTPTLAMGHLFYWSKGALERVPISGGQSARVVPLARAPQYLAASNEAIAWAQRESDGSFAVQSLHGSETRTLHTTQGSISALAVHEEHIYFVERAKDRSWRLGVLRGADAVQYSASRRGRTPAMLVVAEALYYYDGPSSSVRQVPLDLGQEETLARHVICSPMAVLEHVYCAQPAGLLEVATAGGVRRKFPLRGRSVITALSVTPSRLIWVSDVGVGQLGVESLPLEAAAGR